MSWQANMHVLVNGIHPELTILFTAELFIQKQTSSMKRLDAVYAGRKSSLCWYYLFF